MYVNNDIQYIDKLPKGCTVYIILAYIGREGD